MSSHGSTDNNLPKWFEDWRIKEEKRSKERETWNLGFGIFGTGLSVLAIGLALTTPQGAIQQGPWNSLQ
jgi:hypothetical protein